MGGVVSQNNKVVLKSTTNNVVVHNTTGGSFPVAVGITGTTVFDSAAVSTPLGSSAVTMNDGSVFTGTLGFAAPNGSGSGKFSWTGNLFTTAASLPAGASTIPVTVTATQNGVTTQANINITVNDHTVGKFLANITVYNYAASGITNGYVQFFHGFAPGDVPTGNKVVVKDTVANGGASLLTQQDQENFDPITNDLTVAVVNFQYTGTIAAGGSKTFEVWSVSGSPNRTSSLNFTSITGTTDYKMLNTDNYWDILGIPDYTKNGINTGPACSFYSNTNPVEYTLTNVTHNAVAVEPFTWVDADDSGDVGHSNDYKFCRPCVTSSGTNGVISSIGSTILNDNQIYEFHCAIYNNSGATPFPAISIKLTGGTVPVVGTLIVNTANGTAVAKAGEAPLNFTIEPHPKNTAFWRVRMRVQNNSSGNTNLKYFLYPAASTDGTTWDTSGTLAGTNFFYDSICGYYDNNPWTASLNAAFSAMTPELIKSGPVCSEWRAWAPVIRSDGVTQDPCLWHRWYLRLYNDGVTHCVVGSQIDGYIDSPTQNGFYPNEWARTTPFIYKSTFQNGNNVIPGFGSSANPSGFIQHYAGQIWLTLDGEGMPYRQGNYGYLIAALDPAYALKAKLIFKFDPTLASQTLTLPNEQYYPNYWPSGINRALSTTGGSQSRGWIPTWGIQAWSWQNQTNLRQMRARMRQADLGVALVPMHFSRKATGYIPVVGLPQGATTSTYSVLGAYDDTFDFNGRQNRAHYVTSISGRSNGVSSFMQSHWPDIPYASYIMEGERWFWDMYVSAPIMNIIQVLTRNKTFGTTTYYCNIAADNEYRGVGWALRTMDNCAWVCPMDQPGTKQRAVHDFLLASIYDNFEMVQGYYQFSATTRQLQLGMWIPDGLFASSGTAGVVGMWQIAFVTFGTLMGWYRRRPVTDTVLRPNFLEKFAFGIWQACEYNVANEYIRAANESAQTNNFSSTGALACATSWTPLPVSSITVSNSIATMNVQNCYYGVGDAFWVYGASDESFNGVFQVKSVAGTSTNAQISYQVQQSRPILSLTSVNGTATVVARTLEALGARIANPGSGYTDGTYTVTAVGGTSYVPAQFKVTVSGGSVTSVTAALVAVGQYIMLPAGTVTVTGLPNTGSGATFFLDFFATAISNAGTGYTDGTYDVTFVNAPNITFRATVLGGIVSSITRATSTDGLYTALPTGAQTVIGLSGTGSGATFTLAVGSLAGGHALLNGQVIKISGAANSAYNKTTPITVSDMYTFTYPITGNPGLDHGSPIIDFNTQPTVNPTGSNILTHDVWLTPGSVSYVPYVDPSGCLPGYAAGVISPLSGQTGGFDTYLYIQGAIIFAAHSIGFAAVSPNATNAYNKIAPKYSVMTQAAWAQNPEWDYLP